MNPIAQFAHDALVGAYGSISTDHNIIPQVITLVVFGFIAKVIHGFTVNMARDRRRQRQVSYGRIYTNEQKDEGHARAGRQCEFSVGLRRCPQQSAHADHFYPFSRGGATSMKNFVAACEFHNLSKGAKMPSASEKATIENRRRRYFPSGVSTEVGEWA
jgi:5-methylcytosine-specific restriction endonuclease McrA